MPRRQDAQRPTGLSFITHEEGPNNEARRKLLVRRHAALASASLRKATIAAKQATKAGNISGPHPRIKVEKQRRRKSQPSLSVSSFGSFSSRKGSITTTSISAPSSATSASPSETRKDSISPMAPVVLHWSVSPISPAINTSATSPRPDDRAQINSTLNHAPAIKAESPSQSRRASMVSPQPYPVDHFDHLDNSIIQWHVDYYLTHIAPACSPPPYMIRGILMPGRGAMRDHLWPMTQNSHALFWTLLLCASAHASMNTPVPQTPTACTTLFQQLAMNSVNQALKDNQVDDALICAVAILAICEGAFGSDAATYTHLVGLNAMIAQRDESTGYPEIVRTMLCCSGFDAPFQPSPSPSAPTYSPGLSDPANTANTTRTLPGFERLRRRILASYVPHPLVRAVSACKFFDAMHDLDPARRHYLADQIFRWPEDKTAFTIATYSPISTATEDRIRVKVLFLVQFAGQAMLAHIGWEGRMPTAREMLPEIVAFASDIVDTDPRYDELVLWALFTISALSGELNANVTWIFTKVLRRLGVGEWKAARRLLDDFVYFTDSGALCESLWICLESELAMGRE